MANSMTPHRTPHAHPSDTDRPLSDSEPTRPSPTLSPKVLIVEDDPDLRELIARVLSFEGYFVTEACDAGSMLAAVKVSGESRGDGFDLIVTDVRMPGQTGLDALATLRQAGCVTPTIVVSALPGEMIQPQLQGLGALFLPKPFALENLRKIANRIVAERQTQAAQGGLI